MIREKLERPLTVTERYSIWNTGSLLLLESFERHLVDAQSIEEVVTLLTRQAQTSAKTLEKTLESLIEQIAGLLQCSLSYEEERKLRTIQMVEEAMHFAEDLIETSVDQRVSTFQHMIDTLNL